MKRRDMVLEGAQQLITAENAVENALCEVAHLAGNLGRMRIDSNLSAVLGQDAMSAVAEAITLLTGARGAMVRAHGHLNDVKTKIGCGAVLDGGLQDKGDNDPVNPSNPTGRLRPVAA